MEVQIKGEVYWGIILFPIAVVPREIEDNGHAKFCGVNKLVYEKMVNNFFSFQCRIWEDKGLQELTKAAKEGLNGMVTFTVTS